MEYFLCLLIHELCGDEKNDNEANRLPMNTVDPRRCFWYLIPRFIRLPASQGVGPASVDDDKAQAKATPYRGCEQGFLEHKTNVLLT